MSNSSCLSCQNGFDLDSGRCVNRTLACESQGLLLSPVNNLSCVDCSDFESYRLFESACKSHPYRRYIPWTVSISTIADSEAAYSVTFQVDYRDLFKQVESSSLQLITNDFKTRFNITVAFGPLEFFVDQSSQGRSLVYKGGRKLLESQTIRMWIAN